MGVLVNFNNMIELKDATLHIEDSCFSITVYGKELMDKMKQAMDILPFDDFYIGEDCSTIWSDTDMGSTLFFQSFVVWQNWLMELFPTYQAQFLEQFNDDWNYET